MKIGIDKYKKLIDDEYTDIVDRFVVDKELGIAKNIALKENIFAMFVCIVNKIPVLITG